MKIVFLGTPDFAVASLDILVQNGFDVVGVVTVPDKPAGRGMKLQESAVKKYAAKAGLKILQPVKLKDESFIAELKSLEADIQVIVAFRMLPEVVWDMPSKGTFNLHGSLLPDYRGAAPINWAVMNGEKETGVSTFFLDDKIDTGEIIDNAKTPISENETAGELHDRLMNIGADLVLKTIKKIEAGTVSTQNQDAILNGRAPKLAYKIFKDTCKIDWYKDAYEVHNHIRGLSPYPAAQASLRFPDGKTLGLKIFGAEVGKTTDEETGEPFKQLAPGEIKTDGKKNLVIGCGEGSVKITMLQLAGKKRMDTVSFLSGTKLEGGYIL
jgi:methionyl-tRNA formyltransferase